MIYGLNIQREEESKPMKKSSVSLFFSKDCSSLMHIKSLHLGPGTWSLNQSVNGVTLTVVGALKCQIETWSEWKATSLPVENVP